MSKEKAERNPRRKKAVALTLGTFVAAGAAIGSMKSEEIAKRFVPKPGAAPTRPLRPEAPKNVKRPPVSYILAVDNSRSFIADLPGIRDEMARFLQRTGILQDGDQVSLCTFVEDAKCEDFVVPRDRESLIRAVSNLEVATARKGMRTRINRSINQALRGIENDRPTLAVIRTDAIEDDKEPAKPLPENHPPVVLDIPRQGTLERAEEVKAGLGGKNITIEVEETDGRSFGKILRDYSDRLEAEALSAAQGKADSAFAVKMADYREKTAAYEAELKRYRDSVEKIDGTHRKIKRGIEFTALGVLSTLVSALGALIYLKNRPRSFGFLVDTRNEYPRILAMPRLHGSFSARRISPDLPPVNFKASKDGFMAGEQILSDGMQIAPGVFWFEKHPVRERIAHLTPAQKIDDKKNDLKI